MTGSGPSPWVAVLSGAAAVLFAASVLTGPPAVSVRLLAVGLVVFAVALWLWRPTLRAVRARRRARRRRGGGPAHRSGGAR